MMENKEQLVAKLSDKLASIIEDEVEANKQNDSQWREHYNNVMDSLETEIEDTKEIVADFTESKLSINRIEQEGYLRGLITMVNRFKQDEPIED